VRFTVSPTSDLEYLESLASLAFILTSITQDSLPKEPNSLQPSHRILEEDAPSPPRFDTSSGAVGGKALGGSNPQAASGGGGGEMTYAGQAQGRGIYSSNPHYDGGGYRNPSSGKELDDYSEEARLQESYDGIPYSESTTGTSERNDSSRGHYDHGGRPPPPPPHPDLDGSPHDPERVPYYDTERGAPGFDMDRRDPYDRDDRPRHPDMDPGGMGYNYGSSGYSDQGYNRPHQKDWDDQGRGMLNVAVRVL